MTKKIQLFIISLILLCTNTTYAATFSAQLDVSPVLLSDSFQLTYTAEGSVDDEPDFSPVTKNFDILGTRQSSNISMINGDFKRTKQWILTLRARNSGTYRVPPISFGNEQAPEVEIIVKNVSASSVTSPTQDFIVELEASKKPGLVQEQILITARLLIAQNISNYQFSELRVEDSDTIIESLDKDKQYKTYRGTKPYIIIEKQFAIFPQHPGKLHIQPFVADIGIVRQDSRRGIFDPFNQNTSSKRIQSNSLDLKISAKPKSFTGDNWLPTTSLKLMEDWPRNTKFTAGEPITRTITLQADGLSSVQLPEVKQPIVNHLKQYPDKAVLQDNKSSKGISATLKQKIALIPTQPGSYTLPAIDIPWWNTKTNKVDIAHISKREFTVTGTTTAKNNQQPFSQPPGLNQQPVATLPSVPKTNTGFPDKNLAPQLKSNPIWLWLSIIFIALWLITIFLWWRSSKTKHVTRATNINQPIVNRLKYMKVACSKNNPQEIKTALLEWAKVQFHEHDIKNLSDLANLLESPIAEIIISLNENLYSSSTAPWQCGELYQLCRDFKLKTDTSEKKKNSAELELFNKS